MILKILKILTAIALFINISIALASDIHHFKVIVNPEKVSVWEPIDLTIKAVDKNDEVIKDYEGSVLIFSESDKLAQFPNSIEDNSYTFSKSDEGIVKFENSIKFSKKWKNDIHVYDLSDQTDSILWFAEIEVTEEKKQQNIKIEILSPQNNLTVWSKTITVSGRSNKNHQIKIIVNNKDETLTTTNRDWLFEKEIDSLENWENVIQAYILNSEGKEIWTSKKILLTSDSTLPILNKIKITPNTDVEIKTKLLAEVYATKNLEEVSIIIDDSINFLKEDTDGIYKWEFLAPKKEWEYNINVTLKNEIGNKISEKAKLTLIVIPELKAAEPELKAAEIEKTVENKTPLKLEIKNLKIVKLKTKSVLTWDKVENAIKYEIYKKIQWNELELIDTIKKEKYEINMMWEDVKYEYFAVKAIWIQKFVNTEDNTKVVEKEISWDFSEALKIQTWPKEVLLLLLALIIWFIVFFFSKRKA